MVNSLSLSNLASVSHKWCLFLLYKQNSIWLKISILVNVVPVVLVILAAIAIPVYLGIQNNAKDSAVKSDLTNAKIAVVAYQTDKGTFPAVIDDATLKTYGYTKSDNTATLAYKATPAAGATTFCIDGVGTTGSKFSVTESGAVKNIACP